MTRSRKAPTLALALLLGVATLGAPRAASADRQHTVRPGQTIAAIARRYGRDVSDILAANRMRRGATIRPGMTLVIPDEGVVYVRRGQTLSHVARECDATIDEVRRTNRLRRSSGIRVGQRLLCPGVEATQEAAEEDWGEPDQPGVVSLRRRSETAEVRLRDAEGNVPREGLCALQRLMRRRPGEPPPETADAPEEEEEPTAEEPEEPEADVGGDADDDDEDLEEDEDEEDGEEVHEGPATTHPRLALVLAAISDHFGGRRITIQSGFREAGGYTRETSRHVSGRATDIRVHEVPNRAVWDFCRSLANTGCGLYPRSTFVHVDVRERATQWVDWSRPGARPRYGDLRGPRARRNRRLGRRVTRPELVPSSARVVVEPASTAASSPASDAPASGDAS